MITTRYNPGKFCKGHFAACEGMKTVHQDNMDASQYRCSQLFSMVKIKAMNFNKLLEIAL